MKDIEGLDKVLDRLKPHWPEIDAHFMHENDLFKSLLAEDHDLIGRVLKCHLIVEHYLGRFISSHYCIRDLSKTRLSFSQKAQLLPDASSAAAFVKPGILRLNKIRNDFGHTLQPGLSFSSLGPINDILGAARQGASFSEPIEAIEAFTTVASTFLIVPPPNLQQIFLEAFSDVRVNALQ
jgi:hypothetical protein